MKRSKRSIALASAVLLGTMYPLSAAYAEGTLSANSGLSEYGGTKAGSTPSSVVKAVSVPLASGSAPKLVPGLPGTLVGSYFMLNPNIGQLVQNLVIPKGVRAVYDFGLSPDLTIAGNLVNSGRFYAVSSNSALSSATISALNITNNQGALITSVLPANGIPGFSNSNLNLNLNAGQNIVNQGSIVSAGNLNVTAGSSVVNAAQGAQAVMQATGNLNLYAGAGLISNAGLIQSATGNVNISAAINNDIILNNTKGVIEALAGNINFRDNLYAEKSDLRIFGGDFIANALNLNSGCGVVDVLAETVHGTVNVVAGETHVAASTNDLVLGDIKVSGDPAFYNTNPNGDITIAGALQFSGQDLAVVAQRNILTAPGASVIDTSSTSGKGGDIIFIAGANVSASSTSGPAAPGSVLPNTPDGNDANITLTINGGSSSGGRIDLTAGSLTQFDSSSTVGRGGNVTIAAFNGGDVNSGSIAMPAGVSVVTGGAGGDIANSNGNVLVIAGAKSGAALSMGPIDTRNTTGPASATQTGSVNVLLTQPALQSGTPMTITGGTAKTGALIGSSTAPTGAVSTGNLDIQSESGVSISSPGSLTLGNLSSTGNSVLIAAGQHITSAASSVIDINTADPDGIGRTAQFVAGMPVSYSTAYSGSTTPGVNTRIAPSGAQGGDIDLSASTDVQINTSATAGDANGGEISMAAFAGSSSGGSIKLPTNSHLNASGAGNGLGGNVIVFGGGKNITLGNVTGDRVQVHAAQPQLVFVASNINYDNRGRNITVLSNQTVDRYEPLIPSLTLTAGDVTLNGNISVASVLKVITNGIITVGNTSTISADAAGPNSPAGNIFMLGTTVSAAGSTISADASGTGHAGNIYIRAIGTSPAGDITTGNISAAGGIAGSISLSTNFGNVTTGNLTASGEGAGGDVTVVTAKNITIGNIETFASSGPAGNVVAYTGNKSNSAVLTVGSIDASGVSAGGLVMLVNSALTTSANNLTVGAITTEATGLNGLGGPVSLVSTGGITISNISTKADANALSTTAKGGSVFISTGDNGGTAIMADGVGIDTSATVNAASNVAGNIILLTAFTSTGANPSNISKTGATFTAGGDTPRTPFFWGINGAPQVRPASINVTPTAAINITPGGYQDFPTFNLALTLDTGGDSQLVVPLNSGIGDAGSFPSTSMYVSSFTQASGNENVAFLGSGPISISSSFSTGVGTRFAYMVTPSELRLGASSGGFFNVDAGSISLAAGQNIETDNTLSVNLNASQNVSLLGKFNNTFGTLSSSLKATAGNNIVLQDIGTNVCCAGAAGSVTLSAGGSITGQNFVHSAGANPTLISAGSYVSLGYITNNPNSSGGGGTFISSGDYTSTHNLYGFTSGARVATIQVDSGSTINVGSVYVSGGGYGGHVNMTAPGAISVQNIDSDSDNIFGGNINLRSSGSYISVGSITAGNNYGGQIILTSATHTDIGDLNTIGGRNNSQGFGSGSISITAGTSISVGNVRTWSFSGGSLATGELVMTSGTELSFKSIQTGFADPNFAGNVYLSAGTTVQGGNINTFSGQGGNVHIAANDLITVGRIDASHISGCAGNCGGGNVMLMSANGSITVMGSINTSSTNGIGGSVALTAAGPITVSNIKTTSSTFAGNVFVSSGSSAVAAVSIGAVDTSSSSAAANSPGSIFLGANVAGTNGPQATGNANIVFTKTSSLGGSATVNPYLFYNGPSSIISANSTVQVKYSGSSTSVDIVPGPYTSIGSSGTPVSLILDLGGDSRTLAPIVSKGDIYLSGFTADNSGAIASQKNGYAVLLSSTGNNGIILSGNVSSKASVGGTNGLVSLVSLENGGNTAQSSGTITGGVLNINSVLPSTDLGSSGQPIAATITGLNLSLGNSADAFIDATGATVSVLSATAGGDIQITSSGSLSASAVSSPSLVNLKATAGTLSGWGGIVAPTIILNASGNISGAGTNPGLKTVAQNLNVSSGGNAVIENYTPSLVLGNSSTSGDFTLSNAGEMKVTGTVSGGALSFTSGRNFSAVAASSLAPSKSLTVDSKSGLIIESGTLNLTPGSNAGKGATITLTAATTARVNDTISSTPYGTITITTNSAVPFVIGPGNTSANGVNGSLIVNGTGASATGGTVSVKNNGLGGITLLDPSYITVSQPGVVLSVGGNINLETFSAPIIIDTIGALGTFSTDGAAGGAAGSISLKANNSNGGSIVLPNDAHIAFSMNGINTGTNIASLYYYYNDQNTDIQVGTGNGKISISATGGGKSITLSAGGGINVEMSSITYDKPGYATSILFECNKNLFVNGDIDVSGTSASNDLQSITLLSYSSTPFTIGPNVGTVNGVNGKLIANGINDSGGFISVRDPFGGINLLDPSYISVATSGATLSTGGRINIDAGSSKLTVGFAAGNKNVNNVLTGILSVDSQGSNSTFTSADPRIDINAAQSDISGGNLVLSANGGDGYKGGKINFSISGNPLTIGTGVGEFQAHANFSQIGGTGGQIYVYSNQSDITVVDGAAISASSPPGFSGTAGIGGSITFNNYTNAVLNLGGGTIKADGAGSAGQGGKIVFQVPSIIPTANTILSASGQSKAGTIDIALSKANNVLKIGAGSNEIQFRAEGGGGLVKIDTSGNVFITGNSSVFSVVDDTVAILANHIDYTNGFMDVGRGTLQLTSNTSGDIIFGGLVKDPNEFDLTATEFANTRAGTLLLGNPFATFFGTPQAGNNTLFSNVPIVQYPVSPHVLNLADIVITTDVDFRRFGVVAINSTGAFNAAGKTILVSGKLQIVQSGNLTSGTITGGSGATIDLIQFNRNGQPNFDFIVSGPLTVQGSGSVNIFSGAKANMVLNADVGGGSSGFLGVGLDGTIKQTAGVVAATNLTLLSQSSLGNQPPQTVLYSSDGILNIDTRNLTTAAFGDIYLNNVGTSRLSIESATAGGSLYISSQAPIITVGVIKAVTVVLATNSNSDAGITIGNNVTGTLLAAYSNNTNHAITLAADGTGRIVQTSGTLTGSSILLQTGGGNIGSANKAISTSSNNDITINIGTGLRGSAYVSNTGNVTLFDSQAGAAFNFKNSGNLVVNNLATGSGSIDLVSTGGNLTVNSGSVIDAVGGNLTIQVPNNRTITINANASLNAASTDPSKGDVFLAAGTVQKTAGAGAPSNTTVNTLNGGVIYFGTLGISAPSSPNNIITADTNDVAFFTTSSANQIVLGGGVKISARPVSHYLNNIDLRDPANVAQIQTLISEGVISGSLQVTGGIATGGSISIPQDVLIGGLGIFAFKIPQNVTVQFTGTWTNSTPLNINAGVCSNCTQVVQQGNVNFPVGSDAVINVGMPNQNGRNNYMDSNKISAQNLTIYVKMDPEEFFAAPIPIGSANPYLDDCPSGKTPVPAPASQKTGPFTAVYCSGGSSEGGHGPIAGGANSSNSGGGSGAPAPAPNLPVKPGQSVSGRLLARLCKEKKKDEDCDKTKPQFGIDKNGKKVQTFAPEYVGARPVPNLFPSQDPELSSAIQQLRNDSLANLWNNCHGTTQYLATGGQSQIDRSKGPLSYLDYASAYYGSLTRKPNETNALDFGAPGRLIPPGPNYLQPYPFDPCKDLPNFKPGDIIHVTNGDGDVHSATVTNVDASGRPIDVIETSSPGSNDLHSRTWDGFLQHYGTPYSGYSPTFNVYSKL